MASEDITPVTRPGHGQPSNGIPEPIEFEDTNEIIDAVKAGGTSENLMSALVGKALESFIAGGGKPGGGDSSDKTLKEIKKHKWLAGLMSLLLGSGGMVGSYYALKARAESNTEKVHRVEAAAKATEPRIQKNTDEIWRIKVDVTDIGEAVGGMQTQQTAIVNGIESLKQVNVDRLEKENAKLERELRRLRREDR